MPPHQSGSAWITSIASACGLGTRNPPPAAVEAFYRELFEPMEVLVVDSASLPTEN